MKEAGDHALGQSTLRVQIAVLEREQSYLTILRDELTVASRSESRTRECKRQEQELQRKRAALLNSRAKATADKVFIPGKDGT